MKIEIKVDAGDTPKTFEEMTPERFMKNWAAAIADEEVTGTATGSVYSGSCIAEHVHTEGVIRPSPPAKFPAIPIDKSVRRKKIFARDYPWPGGKPAFMKEKSGKVYLGERRSISSACF